MISGAVFSHKDGPGGHLYVNGTRTNKPVDLSQVARGTGTRGCTQAIPGAFPAHIATFEASMRCQVQSFASISPQKGKNAIPVATRATALGRSLQFFVAICPEGPPSLKIQIDGKVIRSDATTDANGNVTANDGHVMSFTDPTFTQVCEYTTIATCTSANSGEGELFIGPAGGAKAAVQAFSQIVHWKFTAKCQ